MPNFQRPKISWPANGVPVSEEFNDNYFGGIEAEQESRHVYIDGNNLISRWNALKHQDEFSTFIIGESGFGTGLNFLAAWQTWCDIKPLNANLHFISIEKYPLNTQELAKALAYRPSFNKFSQQLLDQYPNPLKHSVNQMSFNRGSVRLTLIFDDIIEGIKHLAPYLNSCNNVKQNRAHYGNVRPIVDAWFLDGFAPSKNPSMWTLELFKLLAQVSGNDTTLATFTVAGHVRKALIEAGFSVRKTPGFGKKLEMTAGFYLAGQPEDVDQLNKDQTVRTNIDKHPSRQKQRIKNFGMPSWHLCETKPNIKTKASISIIGAGLAGAHTANALAKRGYKVAIFDKGTIASGASGNPQGVVYSRFSHQDDALALFNDIALPFADNFYNPSYYHQFGQRCGVMHLANSDSQNALFETICERYRTNLKYVSPLTEELLFKKTGLSNKSGGLMTQFGGWLKPAELCKALLNHTNISIVENTSIQKLLPATDGDWQLMANDGEILNNCNTVIITNSYSAKEFSQTQHLTLKPIRGQMSYAEQAPNTALDLECCICTDGYVAPSFNDSYGQNILSFGATFDIKNASDEVLDSDNEKNLTMLSKLLSPTAMPILTNIKGRVSFRCTTRDYLPIIGPVCDFPKMLSSFSAYRKNKYQTIDCPGQFQKNLFINVGHGSRGLSYTPLSAEIIACLINGEPLPIDEDLYKQIHPGRFIVRDLARNKI